MKLVRRLDPYAPPPNNDDVGSLIAKRIADWRKGHNAEGRPKAPKERHISQLDMAKLAGVSVGCLQGAEKGTRATEDAQLAKIAKLMGTTLDDLKQGDTDDRVLVLSDPRGERLNDEDYEIANWFHDSHTAVKVQVRLTLEQHARQRDGRAPLPTPAPLTDRRSGEDRRSTAHDQQAADADRIRHWEAEKHRAAAHDFIDNLGEIADPAAQKKKVE